MYSADCRSGGGSDGNSTDGDWVTRRQASHQREMGGPGSERGWMGAKSKQVTTPTSASTSAHLVGHPPHDARSRASWWTGLGGRDQERNRNCWTRAARSQKPERNRHAGLDGLASVGNSAFTILLLLPLPPPLPILRFLLFTSNCAIAVVRPSSPPGKHSSSRSCPVASSAPPSSRATYLAPKLPPNQASAPPLAACCMRHFLERQPLDPRLEGEHTKPTFVSLSLSLSPRWSQSCFVDFPSLAAAPSCNPPARPLRTQQHAPSTTSHDQPRIPPRPIRKTDPSPDREAFTRSPLNDLPGVNGGIGRPPSRPSNLGVEAPRRPPSISFQSDAGQEGSEYDSYDQLPPDAHGVKLAGNEATTRNVSADIPLHAPKASLAQSTAKSRIASVTRTDSTQAAAAGIGKARPDDDTHMGPTETHPLGRVTSRDDHIRRPPSTDVHPLRARASFNRSSSSLPSGGTPRPPSIHSVDHHDGIPTHGMYVPLLADRGDVQAPSPGPAQTPHAPGIGFFADGSGRNHHRKRSSRHEFGPPDSYGLHGHGLTSQDQFEKEWVQKHPEEAAKEGYATFTPRPSTALTTEQLNKLVHENQDVGMGTDRRMIGTPTQHEIAFDATDIFNSRMSTPANNEGRKRGSSGQQPPIDPSLHKAAPKARSVSAYESDDDHVYHIEPHYKRGSKITGGGAHDGALDLGPHGGNSADKGGWIHEEGDGTPILASDEIIKRPGSAFLEPAVNPEFHDYDSDHYSGGRRRSVDPPSRPSSRPGSTHGGVRDYHGGPLHRYTSHEHHDSSGMGTPLEEIEEYEPLFPDDEKPRDPALKRPSVAHHHFPSQDIWEDTPASLRYETTVETPELERVAAAGGRPEAVFETPEQEQRRRDNNPADMTSSAKTFAKPHFKPGVQDDLHASRPGVQRFPSSDIWEDTPDSMRLETTVSGPQMDEMRSAPEERPTTTAIPHSQDDGHARSTTTGIPSSRPSVPARPTRHSKLAQEISPDPEPQEKEVPDLGLSNTKSLPVPDRPKPAMSAQSARTSNLDPADGASYEAAHTKSKPAVPARPSGGKIAALQAGFMNDLNKRLQLGPQGPPPRAKEAEPDENAEQAPLADARKSRVKGPARRGKAAESSALGFSFSSPMVLFQIDETDELTVGAADDARPRTAEIEQILTANAAGNTSLAAPASPPHPAGAVEPSIEERLASAAEAVGAEGDVPEPTLAPASEEKAAALQPDLETSLAHAEPAPTPTSGNQD
nr:hypothetical protein CFP56_21531 [Quercus suber]